MDINSSRNQQPAEDGVHRTPLSFEGAIRRRRCKESSAATERSIKRFLLHLCGLLYLPCWFINITQSLSVTSCTTESTRAWLPMAMCQRAELDWTCEPNSSCSEEPRPNISIGRNLTGDIQRLMVAPLELSTAHFYLQADYAVARRSPLIQGGPLPRLLQNVIEVIELTQPGLESFVDGLCLQMDDVVSFHRNLVANLNLIAGLPVRADGYWLTHIVFPFVETVRLLNLYFESGLNWAPRQYPAAALYKEVIYQVDSWARRNHQTLDRMTNGFLRDDFPAFMSSTDTLLAECSDGTSDLGRELAILKSEVKRKLPVERAFFINTFGIDDLHELRPHNVEKASLTGIETSLRSLSAVMIRFRRDHRTMKNQIGTLQDRFHLLTSEDLLAQGGRRLRDAIASLKQYGEVIGGSGINAEGWVAQQAGERMEWLKGGKGMRVGKMVKVEERDQGVWTWLNVFKLMQEG